MGTAGVAGVDSSPDVGETGGAAAGMVAGAPEAGDVAGAREVFEVFCLAARL